jgi:hypothetical protein
MDYSPEELSNINGPATCPEAYSTLTYIMVMLMTMMMMMIMKTFAYGQRSVRLGRENYAILQASERLSLPSIREHYRKYKHIYYATLQIWRENPTQFF